MNVLFLSLLYHPSTMEEVGKNSKDGFQNQINNYQWAFVEGLQQTLGEGERLSVLNCLPVGVFPMHYRMPTLPSRRFSPDFMEIGCMNLPWLKQRGRMRRAEAEMERWVRRDENNRHILLYTLYLPYMKAVERVKARHPDVKATVIVTDLPNELGISSGRRGMLKKLEYQMGDTRIEACRAFDGFVLLTKEMADVLPIAGKADMVLEGLVLPQAVGERSVSDAIAQAASERPVVLYTGTLNAELGIGELLQAFEELPAFDLWLCGRGDMQANVEQAAARQGNIHYFGLVSQQEALVLQSKATLLINPRSAAQLFTKYSFPSKTLEYMRSGKPVLCYPLQGIPAEYAPYLQWIVGEGAKGIAASIRQALEQAPEELESRGRKARDFVLEHKNPVTQCRRLVKFLRSL